MTMTFTVTTLADELAGTDNGDAEALDGTGLALREVIRLAEFSAAEGVPDVEIVFDAALAGGTLTLELGSLVISQSIAIHGDALGGGNGDVIISGGDQYVTGGDVYSRGAGVIDIVGTHAADVTINDLTVTGAEQVGPSPVDINKLAGIGIGAGAVVTMNEVKISSNQLEFGILGGGIRNFGTLTLTNSEVSGNSSGRSFFEGTGGGIYNEGVLVIDKTLISGNATGGRMGGQGAGIANAGSLVMTNSVVIENDGGRGAGLYNTGDALLINSTIANNSTDGAFFGEGNGITNEGSLTLIQSTVSGHQDNREPNPQIESSGDVTLVNSIVIDDVVVDDDGLFEEGIGVDVIAGTLTLLGGNIVGTDVYFGATDIGNTTDADVLANGGLLTNNGGPLPSILLNPTALNPAVDGGDSSLADDADGNPLLTDARGLLRDVALLLGGDVGFSVDLGAVELQSLQPVPQPKLRVDGRQLAVRSFGHGEDEGGFAVSPDGRSLVQNTDSWKEVGNVKLTKDTVLIFDFTSGNEGEVHGIGFDNAAGLKRGNVFQLLGTETYGNQMFNDLFAVGERPHHYEIPVGQLIAPTLIGKFLDLVFITDDDARGGSNSTWSNIEFEERPTPPSASAELFA